MIPLWTDAELDWNGSDRDYDRHMNERMERGFSCYDAWSFDVFIASIIANYAEYLQLNGHGYPIGFTPEKWNKVLEKIKIGFANYAEHKFDDKLDVKSFNHAMELFKANFESFWD